MKSIVLILFGMTIFSVIGSQGRINAENVKDRNLTSILSELSKTHKVKFSYSATLTNKIYPDETLLSDDLESSLNGILKGTGLSYRKSRVFYCIFVAKRAPQYVPVPEPEEIPEPEIVEQRDSIIPLVHMVSASIPTTASYPLCVIDNPKNNIITYSRVPEVEEESFSKFQIKTNLIYDLSSTINIGFEYSLNKNVSVELSLNANPWTYEDNKKTKIYMVQPELRYWGKEVYKGHFVAIHGLAGAYDLSGMPPWSFGTDKIFGLLEIKPLNTHSFKGWFVGGGLSYGYLWRLNSRLGVEANLGLGYVRFRADEFYSRMNYKRNNPGYRNYYGITKAGLSVTYILK